MDNALLVGLSTQESLRRRMDVVANNLANMNTAGFKAEVALNDLVVERPAEAMDTPEDIRFTQVERLHRDMSAGTMAQTGNPLDLGLFQENAFFTVRVGERRAGDPPELVADPTAIKDEIGWQARFTDIDETVRSAWDWFNANPEGYA